MLRNLYTKTGVVQNLRQFGSVTKYTGKNINVTQHNKDKREEFTGDSSFWGTWNMPYEHFSKPFHPPKMHPVQGNKGEFLFLAILFPAVIMAKASRKKNEEGLRSQYGFSNNRYAHFTT